LAVCIVCGKFEGQGLTKSMEAGWTFIRCPECQRGTPLDILAVHLAKTTPEQYLEGFCPEHWFRDSGICAYCKIRRGPMGAGGLGGDLA
jgi:hypothetical protein